MGDEKTPRQAIDLPPSPFGVVSTTNSSSSLILVGQNKPDCWVPIEYELCMFRAARDLNATQQPTWALENIVREGLLLHTRNLCELFLEKRDDDIKLTDLFSDWKTSAQYDEVKKQVDELLRRYQEDGGEGESLKTALDKRLAHLTRRRTKGPGHDYTPKFAPLASMIESIFVQIEDLLAV